jgi:magnesium-transporting ATPase (P-type)
MKEKRTQEKNKGAKTNSLATIYTVALIIVAFAVILISSLLLPTMRIVGVQPEGTPPFMEEARRSSSTDLNSYFTLRIVLSVLNTILVVYLLFVYVRNYLVLKSSFTLGIVAFLFSFLLYALSSIPLVHMLFGPFRISEVFSFVPMLFSAIGLIIFAKLSNE